MTVAGDGGEPGEASPERDAFARSDDPVAPSGQDPPARRRRLSLSLVLATCYAVAVAILLLAWLVVGDAWWLQPFNLTTFWWTLPGVFLVALALLLRRWRLAAALALPALAWVWLYGGMFLPTWSRPGPADLVVASFNTWVGADDVDHVIELAERVEPDVLLLQEVFPARQELLEEQLAPMLPHVTTIQSEGVGGVMVASRHPIVDHHPVQAPSDEARETAVVVLDIEGQLVQVVPVHLRSPCPTCGDSLVGRLSLEGRSRHDEMAAVLASLSPQYPAIVGGDFNSSDRSDPHRLLVAAGFVDVQRAAGSGPGFTWPAQGPAPIPLFRIDWLFVRGLTVVDAWVDDPGPSDHRPVVSSFALGESS